MRLHETKLETHVCVLFVGVLVEGDVPRQTPSPLGTLWAFETIDEAWRVVQSWVDEHPDACVLMDRSEVIFQVDGWRGPALERMATVALGVRRGHVVLSHELYEVLRAHDHLSRNVALLEWDGASWWQMSLEDEPIWDALTWRMRTNIQHDSMLCLGRDAFFEEMDQGSQAARSLEVCGIAGAGKTLVVRRWLERMLLSEHRAQVWWISLLGLRDVSEVASELARLWRVELSQDTSSWADMLGRRFAAADRWTWVVLDDIDGLEPGALAWLRGLLAQSAPLRWVITSRQARQWPDAESLQVPPLSLRASIELLDRRSAGGSRPPMSTQHMEMLSHWAAMCQGHALSLNVVARALTPAHVLAVPEVPLASGDDDFDAQLHVAWLRLSEHHQDALCALTSFERIFERDMAMTLIAKALKSTQEDASHMFDALANRAWLQVAPTRDEWWIPSLVKHFVQGQYPAHAHQHHHEQLIQEKALEWSEALDSEREHQVLKILARYERDIVSVVERLTDRGDANVCEIVVALRRYFQRAHFSASYASLLARTLEKARARQWSEEIWRLEVCDAIVADRTLDGHLSMLDLIGRSDAHLKHLTPDVAVELVLLHARCLDDCADEQVDRSPRFALAEHAYQVGLDINSDATASRAATLLGDMWSLSDVEKSLMWAERAQALAERCGVPSLLSRSAFALHRAYMGAGRIHEGKVMARRAYDAAMMLDLPELKAMMVASLGYASLYLGEHAEARRLLHTTVSISQQSAFNFGEANGSFLLGTAYMADAQFESARSCFEQALEIYEQADNAYNIHMCRLWLGSVLVCVGMLSLGRAHMEAAQDFFETHEITDIAPSLGVLTVLPEIYQAAWIDRSNDALDAVEMKIKPLEQPTVRLECLIVSNFLQRARVVVHAETGLVMEVAEDLQAYRPPESEWINIRRRRTLKRVFAALVQKRQDAPGDVMMGHELFEAGWPGEQPEARSGMMRLYVAINALRALGLEGILETTGEGYRLDPGVRIKIGMPPGT